MPESLSTYKIHNEAQSLYQPVNGPKNSDVPLVDCFLCSCWFFFGELWRRVHLEISNIKGVGANRCRDELFGDKIYIHVNWFYIHST